VSKFNKIISVHNLSKSYEPGAKPIKKLQNSLFAKSQSFENHPNKQIVALDKVTFELEKGFSLGILGLNGSGKSTLLQIIANTLKPSSGTVKVNGSVSALLELGSGFNPDFTGRENCFLNGALMGNSSQKTSQKIPEIENFAEIGEFFDMPLRTYSTGMQMRLAFALATCFQPDVLIVDEALSVGDTYFQAKCFEKISKLKKAGMSLILVTHSVNDIPKYCEHALLLDKGKIISYGKPREITNLYLESLHKETVINNNSNVIDLEQLSFISDVFHKRPYYRKEEHRWGNKKAKILDYLIQNEKNNVFPNKIRSTELLSISYSVVFNSFV
jgi:lipopolysaccharide transport system ATP-binding protein